MDKRINASSITGQLRLVFAASIILLLISSAASFYSNRKLIEASQLVNHTNDVIKNAEELISTVKDAETGQRGYIITNDSSFLVPYYSAYDKALASCAALRELTNDNPSQQRNIAIAKATVDRRFKHLNMVLGRASKMTLLERYQLFGVDHHELSEGRNIMLDMRNIVEQIKDEERRLLEIRTREQNTYIKYTPTLVIVAALISVLISILAYFRIKADMDARVAKQQEEQRKYKETEARIGELEQVTRRISNGDYAVRSTDERKDELGRVGTALNSMATALETNFKELERRNWLQTGTVKLGNAMRGVRKLNELSEKIAAGVAHYTGAQVATLYVADKEHNLRLRGQYAATNAQEVIPHGTGLMGQTLRTQETLVTDRFPAGYMTVASSLGKTEPVYLVIMPLVFGGTAIGAVEMGFMDRPGDMVLAFLNMNIESVAIALSGAINYERTQELLEETQSQAEELQSQHSELEHINAELEVQTEKLQASEEELRVQQEELQQANQELQERSRLLEERNQVILERNLEVQRKAEELEASTRYKSEFLANMSHELRTPLNSILLLSRLLSENGDQNLSTDQVEYANVIQSSGNGLLALIDEILDLSKIEAGKMSLEFEHTKFSEIGMDMQAIFDPMARDKKLQFIVDIDNRMPDTIETDKMRLEQIVKNLVSNALKFTSKGSITMRVAPGMKNGYADISVVDTGIGIPADKQKLIFEAFQQADGSTRRKYGGTGLGLSISKELARLLGGDISLSSEPDKGSTFTITIPLRRQQAITEEPITTRPEQERRPMPVTEASHTEAPKAVQPARFIASTIPENIPDDRSTIKEGDKNLLIIEDDTNFAKSLLEFTRKKGYKGIVAVRGDEGVQLARQFRPAGILLDVQLPVKNGLEVMEELKADVATRHIPVHMMSSESVKKESLQRGAVDFISKPFAFEQMHTVFNKLEQVLSKENRKVLIVEDNPQHARALAYFLETFNVNTDIKTSISASVNALTTDTDCVILDMGIPDEHAYNTLEEVKKNPGLENLPIIIFTGKNLSMAEESRIKQYADSIVVKTAHSYQRILDEVSIFLHLVEARDEQPEKKSFRKLGVLNDVLNAKTVLIVDDDVRNIFSLTKALEQVNMNIVTAIDGKEAIQRLQEQGNIDVVLLDMMMPQMDGYETATRIRQNPAWKKLPVIAVTAKAMMGDREKCIKAGASDYITKPVDIDQLLSLLRVWLYDKTII